MFRYTKATAVREVLVWIVTLIGLLPFYLLVVTALKPDEEVLTTSAVAPPSSIDFGAFVEVLTTTGRNSIPMSILNSVIITAGATVLAIAASTLAGYAYSRYRGRALAFSAFFLIFIRLIPPIVITLPLFPAISEEQIGLVIEELVKAL